MEKNKLVFNKEELEDLINYKNSKLEHIKNELVYDKTYDKFLTLIGCHKNKNKFNQFLKSQGYFFNYNGIYPVKKAIQEGYFYYKDSKNSVNGNTFRVLYISKRGIELLFYLLEQEASKMIESK